MKKSEIQRYIQAENYGALIDCLEAELEEEYDEYSMLSLARAYLIAERVKDAKKILKRLKRLYPAGEYLMDVDTLIADIDRTVKKAADQTEEITLRRGAEKKQKKQVILPATIRKHFAGVVGLEDVQIELDRFYKLLRFQNERKQKDFQGELLKYSHFAIAGPRGSGKTMVGDIIAKLLYEFGVREDDKPIQLEAAELANAYAEKKAEGVSTLFSQLQDATVIIENIQDAIGDDSDGNDGAKGLAVALEKVMRDRREQLSILMTGSVQAINKLFLLSETLQDALYGKIEIPPYTTMELLSIAQDLAKKRALLISDEGKKSLLRKIDMECRSSEFMNAITLMRYLNEAAVRLAQRYYSSDEESETAMVYLTPEDFEMELEEEGLEELLEQMDRLTGLAAVKKRLKKQIESIQTAQAANLAGAERKGGTGTLHMVFEGNPGTGKTTVARIVGKIYQQLGILPRGNHMVECTRSDLVGRYQGETARLVKEKAREALGGVLFIDEAYALCRDGNDTFGHEAVDQLIVEIENNKDFMMVILAGYTEEMKEFLKKNPGFNSRIPHHIIFEDYSVEEMTEIFRRQVEDKGMILDPEADSLLHGLIEVKSKTPDFGNARGVRNLMEEVLEAANSRLANAAAYGQKLDKKQYDTIRKEDVQVVAGKKLAGEKTLEKLLAELSSLTGLASVKAKVQEMVDDMQVKSYLKDQGISNADTGGHGTLHLVFKGNAGTGKTTVARLIGQIYNKLGVLSKNVFVETGRKDLVANYSGQTATKVMAKVKEAEGGILFIDEAYTLINGEQDEFGREAINTLVAELENRRENLMVIVAGYSDDMQRFLDANQGLASRLSNEIVFDDYTEEELISILCGMAERKGLSMDDEAIEAAQTAICKAKAAVKDFGNARGVRNILEQAEKKKNSRIAAMMRAGEKPDWEIVTALQKEDFMQ